MAGEDEERRGFNPLRSEAEAFRLLIWVVAIFAVLMTVVLVARAIF